MYSCYITNDETLTEHRNQSTVSHMIYCLIHQRKGKIYCLRANPTCRSKTLSHEKQNSTQIILLKIKGTMALPLKRLYNY